MSLPRLLLLTPGLDFIKPYLNAELSGIYDIITDASIVPDHTLAIVRQSDLSQIEEKVINTLLITSDTVIGTGMNGLGRTLAEAIARGRLYHIKGNDAKVSAIHATTLARAARIALNEGGKYTIADEAVTFDTLIEALASRINGRRVYTIGPKWAKWLMPSDLRQITTTDSVIDSNFIDTFPDFTAMSACEYLTTHDYSNDTI